MSAWCHVAEECGVPTAQNGAPERSDTAGAVVEAFTAAREALGRACRRCGETVPADADRCPKCQSFAAGNQAARTHGLRSVQPPPDLRMSADELIEGIVSGLGGESELSTLKKSYVRKTADVEITLPLLTSHIARTGLITPGGRVRDSFDKLMTGLATFDRLAQRIGLERRSRRVSSLAELMAAQDADSAGHDAPGSTIDHPPEGQASPDNVRGHEG
jgi:ribosomal protein L40E